MDTGYTNLITAEERRQVLRTTRDITKGQRFVAGAFIEGQQAMPLRSTSAPSPKSANTAAPRFSSRAARLKR
jgi:hypothetical protein